MDAEYLASVQREIKKRRAIDAGKIADLEKSESSAREAFDQDGPTSKAKAKGISGGGSRGRKREVVAKPRPRYCANCRGRQTFDVTVCQNCGYPLTEIAELEKQPRCFRITPMLGAFLKNSKDLSGQRGESPVFGVADLLEFWIWARGVPILERAASDPAEQAHMFTRGGDRERMGGERGAPYKFLGGTVAAVEWRERLPIPLVQKLQAAGVDVEKGRKLKRELSLDDAAMTAYEIFMGSRFALLHHSRPMHDDHSFEPIEFDDGSTNAQELATVMGRIRIFDSLVKGRPFRRAESRPLTTKLLPL